MNAELFGMVLLEEHLAVAMILALFLMLLAGFPVAFTLGGIGVIFGFIGLDLAFFNLLPQRIFGILENTTLLAVPLFIFMGVMLERSGIAENLLESMTRLFGRLRSGLALSVIFSGVLLAASTGVVGASVVTMGLISLPLMLKRGYSPSFSSGVICASGTLGQIIPPSIVLILLGDIMGVSVGELFLAAVLPGLMLVVGYLLYSIVFCELSPPLLSSDTVEEQSVSLFSVLLALLPPGVLIVSVLGSIFFGIASPTEAAAVGAFGAMILALAHGKLSRDSLSQAGEKTMKLTSMVFSILVGAQAFGLAFRGLDGDEVIRDLVLSLNAEPATFLLCIMLLLFVLGCFLDFIEIIFIVIPILSPLVVEFGYSKLWFSVLVAMNLQMSFLTPPFGFALFYLKGVAPPELQSGHLYRGILPFVLIQALMLLVLILWPEIVEILPNYFR